MDGLDSCPEWHPPPLRVLWTPGTPGETGAEVEQLCSDACSGPWNDRAMRMDETKPKEHY